MYLHELKNWWDFKYDSAKLLNLLGRIRMKQGTILGRMYSIGFDYQEDTILSTLSMELVHSSEIEGEKIKFTLINIICIITPISYLFFL